MIHPQEKMAKCYLRHSKIPVEEDLTHEFKAHMGKFLFIVEHFPFVLKNTSVVSDKMIVNLPENLLNQLAQVTLMYDLFLCLGMELKNK